MNIFLRIEHKNIIASETNWFLGPYYACWNKTKYFDNSIKNKLSFLLGKLEDPILERYSHTPAKKLPVTWTHTNPGPIRDPYLRNWYIDKYIGSNQQYVFGNNTIAQLKPWFNNKDLVDLLTKQGFVLRKYKSRYIIHGLRQSVLDTTKSNKLLEQYNLRDFI